MEKRAYLYIFLFIFLSIVTFPSVVALKYDNFQVSKDYADLNFLDPISSNLNETELQNIIIVGKNYVEIDSDKYQEFKNMRATITFKNVSFLNPVLKWNGIRRPDIPLWKLDSHTYQAIITGFSKYEIVDSSWSGTFENSTAETGNYTHSGDAILVFDFNENNTASNIVNDKSVNQFNGTVYDGSNWVHNGSYDDSGNYYFNGVDGEIDLGDRPEFTFTNGTSDLPLSISAWINATDVSIQRGIVTKFSNTGAEYQFAIEGGTGKLFFLVGTPGAYLLEISNTSLNLRVWNNVVVTYDGSETNSGMKLYINGELAETNSLSLGNYQGMANTNGDLRIGSREYVGSRTFFIGNIDDVRLFNRTLSENGVLELNNTIPNNWYKYHASASFTSDIYNYSDYNQSEQKVVWENITYYPDAENVTLVQGRSSENYSNITEESWIDFTKVGNTFYGSFIGQFFQKRMFTTSKTNISMILENYTIGTMKYLIPNVTDLTIFPLVTMPHENLNGTATFILNDTDTGSIIFRWYSNESGYLIFSEEIGGLTNGTNASSTYDHDLGNGKDVYFTAQANNSGVLGDEVNSTSVYVDSDLFYRNCLDTLEIGNNCTIYSQKLNCSTYSIFFNGTKIIDDKNLNALGNDLYFRTFNETEGSYLINFCDGSTREIIVEANEKTLESVMFLLVIFAVLFFVVGIILFKNKGDTEYK